MAKLHTLALAMVGHSSMSGVQRKISVRLDADRNTLQVATSGGQFIFKPQAQTFPSLPENEHVTMRIAALVGLAVPPCGLVQLDDGSWAYVVVRFDRTPAAKLPMEDFCQLAEKAPKEKYDGSAELCFRLIAKYMIDGADQPTDPFTKVALPDGEELVNAHGRCFLRRRRYPLAALHGEVALARVLAVDRARLAALSKDDTLAALDLSQCLFLDTETTGLSGGAGTVMFLCGLAWFEGDGLALEQVFREANDPRVNDAVMAVLPRYLEKDSVLGVGEIGLDDQTKTEEKFYAAQIELARQHDLPVLVHTTHRDKKRGFERCIATLRHIQPDRYFDSPMRAQSMS
jgi:hypothetical protein